MNHPANRRAPAVWLAVWLAVLLAPCACRVPESGEADESGPDPAWRMATARGVALTPGNILKHQDTEVVGVSALRLVDEDQPRLLFRGTVGGTAHDFETDGYAVDYPTSEGTEFARANRYQIFFDRNGRLRARRLRPLSFPTAIEPLLDGTNVHTPVGTASTFVTFFDLRKDPSVLAGALVLPVDTRIGTAAAAADPPKKRLFRIDVDALEQKLGSGIAQVEIDGAAVAAIEPIGPRRTADGRLVWQYRATWSGDDGTPRHGALQTDGEGPPSPAEATLRPADLMSLPYAFGVAAGAIQVRNADTPPRSVTLPTPSAFAGGATIVAVRAFTLSSRTLLVVTSVAHRGAAPEVRLWTVDNASLAELFDAPTNAG